MLSQTFGPMESASSPTATLHQEGNPKRDSLLESTSTRISLGLNVGRDKQTLPQGVLCYQPNPKKPGIRVGFKRAGDLPFAVSGAAPDGVLETSGGIFYDDNGDVIRYTSSTGGFDVAFVYEGVTNFDELFATYPTGGLPMLASNGEEMTTELIGEMVSGLGGNDPWFSTSFLSIGVQSPVVNGVALFLDYLLLPTESAVQDAFTNPNIEGISEARRFNPTNIHKPLVFDVGMSFLSGRLSFEAGTRVQIFNPQAEVMIQAGNTAGIWKPSNTYYGWVRTVYGDGSFASASAFSYSELNQYHFFEELDSNGSSYTLLEYYMGDWAGGVRPTYNYDGPSARLYPFVNLTYILF